MTTEMLSILSGAGAGTIICVLLFYFWLKKIIREDIVSPMIKPLEDKIKDLKENHNTDISEINKKLENQFSFQTRSRNFFTTKNTWFKCRFFFCNFLVAKQ